MSRWDKLEHSVWQKLKEYQLENCSNYILAVSGGLDSIVLLNVLKRLRPESTLKVVHYHHGECSDREQNQFRNLNLEIVKHNISARIDLYFQKSSQLLKSEAEMRTARWLYIREVRNQLVFQAKENQAKENQAKENQVKFLSSQQQIDQNFEVIPILTGHHLDDWLETMLLKMLRGTSADGLSQFKEWNQEIFRPFLSLTKADLKHYAESHRLNWQEDPSNLSADYLRNWLRQEWLPMANEKQPGSIKNMALSIKNLILEAETKSAIKLVFCSDNKEGLDRQWYMTLSLSEQLKVIASFLKVNQIYDFTRGHLVEIQKRLDKNQKDITFDLLTRKWVINATQIMLE